MSVKQYKILPHRKLHAVYWGNAIKFGPAALDECLEFLERNKTTPTAKTRRCLNCKRYFMSTHAGNRRCETCKRQLDNTYDNTTYPVLN